MVWKVLCFLWKWSIKVIWLLFQWYFGKRWLQKNINDNDEVAQRRNEGVIDASLGNQIFFFLKEKAWRGSAMKDSGQVLRSPAWVITKPAQYEERLIVANTKETKLILKWTFVLKRQWPQYLFPKTSAYFVVKARIWEGIWDQKDYTEPARVLSETERTTPWQEIKKRVYKGQSVQCYCSSPLARR